MQNFSSPLLLMVNKLARRFPLGSMERGALLALPHRMENGTRASSFALEGDLATHCSLLTSGFACSYKLTGSGGRQIVAVHLPGDLFDFQPAGRAKWYSIEALGSIEVAYIARSDLSSLAERYPAIAAALWTDLAANASILAEWLLNVGRRDARGRIAHLICELAARQDAAGLRAPGEYLWPLTQDQLADATGLTSVHVNRTLQSLRNEGLIQLRQRSLQILDWNRLRAVADYTPDYLQFNPVNERGPIERGIAANGPSVARTVSAGAIA